MHRFPFIFNEKTLCGTAVMVIDASMDDDFHRRLVRLAQLLGRRSLHHCASTNHPLSNLTPLQHRELQDYDVKIPFHKLGETYVPHYHHTTLPALVAASQPLACFKLRKSAF